MTNPYADELLAKIRSRDAPVGIVGLGYVGLPLAFVEKGFRVVGFDVDPEKVAKLTRGESYVKHLDGGGVAAVAKSVASGAQRFAGISMRRIGPIRRRCDTADL